MTNFVRFIVIFCIVPPTIVRATIHASDRVNSVLVDNMSWSCANNASCLYSVANSVLTSYKRGEVVNFGLFDVEKLPVLNSSSTVGRSSGFVGFLGGNAIRIPVGPMVFSVQRASDDGDYIEIALLKKSSNQGRRQGGGGGGGGLGGGLGSRIGNRQSHKDKKQFQMFVPMYLAATTFGWTLLAVKAVGLLTLKALAISKLAFIVAAMVVIKKLMDNASEKLMFPHYPEPQPFIMPYNMDYGMHAMQGADIATGEMYPLHLAAAAAAAATGGHQHQGLENIGAESKMHQVVDVQNGTQILAGLAKQIGQNQKIKRDDTWMGPIVEGIPEKQQFFNRAARPFLYNYLPSRPMYNVRQ